MDWSVVRELPRHHGADCSDAIGDGVAATQNKLKPSVAGSMLSGWVLGFDAGCLAGSLNNWPARLRCVFLRWWALIGRLDRSSPMVGTNCAVRRAEKSE
jgi:hypothetical protein